MTFDPTDSDDRIPDPEVLLFETSPFGTLDAIVQHDGKSVYFYLNESKQGHQNVFGTRACWVRNLKIGPYVVNEEEMRQGISPMLPRTHTHSREGQPIPDPQNLRIVWLEEGNGAALIELNPTSESSQTLAVIPPWSGLEGFHGYAAECAMESPFCWPMPDNPRLDLRLEQAKEFWGQFESQPDPFSVLQPQILSAYDTRFLPTRDDAGGQPESPPERKYFSIDGGKFPPRGMVSYQTSDELILATVGVSLCPQPAVELFTEDPRNHRRIELAIRLKGDFGGDFGDPTHQLPIARLQKQLSGLAGYPWSHFTWLGNGHTCSLVDVAPGCDSALLVHDSILWSTGTKLVGQNSTSLPEFRGDPINLLWAIPITASEQQRLQASTLTVDELLERVRGPNPRTW